MKHKSFHTASTKQGKGDYYGKGIKQPTGKIISVFQVDVPSNLNKNTAPKSLA